MEQDLERLFYQVIDQLSGLTSSENLSQESALVKPSCPRDLDTNGFVIPLGVSNHHIHLSQADADLLFGEGYVFQNSKISLNQVSLLFKNVSQLQGQKV